MTTRMAAATPRFSIFTLSLPKKKSLFLIRPQCLSKFLKNEKRYRQTTCIIENYIHRKAYVWNMRKIERN